MMQAGLFKSSLSYYAWKVISLLSMFLSVAVVLLHGSSSWASCLAAACLLGITWQQSGWLAHDFLHHQVFKRRHLNNAVGYFLGCLLQGFSVDWWKNKHNMHHAVPNECTDDGVAVDPGTLWVLIRKSWLPGSKFHLHCSDWLSWSTVFDQALLLSQGSSWSEGCKIVNLCEHLETLTPSHHKKREKRKEKHSQCEGLWVHSHSNKLLMHFEIAASAAQSLHLICVANTILITALLASGNSSCHSPVMWYACCVSSHCDK
jgi:hypothetical protein